MDMIDYTKPWIIQSNRVWRTWLGGKILDEIAGEPRPKDGYFPEEWIASTTRAANPGREDLPDEGIGTLQGPDGELVRMDDFLDQSPTSALGHRHVEAFGPVSRLLVKILDSSTRLHIQAHPSAQWAGKHLNSPNGKTEAWWILQVRDADEGWVYMGFQNPPTPQRWREIIADQDIAAMEECFEKIPVRAGDVLLVEGGVPHAIGPGLLLLEVQEPTDFVVRCEYGHGGVTLPESARTMGLGLDAVLDMFDYEPRPAAQIKKEFGPRPQIIKQNEAGCETQLLASPQTDKLELRAIELDGEFTPSFDGRFSVILVLEGAGTISGDGYEIPLKKWTRLLLPAAMDKAKLRGKLKLARCLPTGVGAN